jgi:5' nucleotidase family
MAAALTAEGITSFGVLQSQGKILMLITNSDFAYTDKMMSYAYDEYLPEGKTWRDLFDMVQPCASDCAIPHVGPCLFVSQCCNRVVASCR